METLKFLMTAAFYPPFHLGGDANHVRYLAEALAAQGHDVAATVESLSTREVIGGEFVARGTR